MKALDKSDKKIQRKLLLNKLILSLIIATTFFLIGIILGNHITSAKFKSIENLEQKFKIDTLAYELQYEILKEDPCIMFNTSYLFDLLYEIGSKLDYMEKQRGEDDKDVRRLKEYYNLLELRQWLLMKKVIKQCNSNIVLILYFYAGKKECPKCDIQGSVLTYIRKKHPNVYIFSFDKNIDNPAMNLLKSLYNVKQAPSIIINDKLYSGFHDADSLEKILKHFSIESKE